MKKPKVLTTIVSLLVVIGLLSGCSIDSILEDATASAAVTSSIAEVPSSTSTDPTVRPTVTPSPSAAPTATPTPTPNKMEAVGSISVHFIDVGQGDSILIKTGPSAMLIDAGNINDADLVENYIKKQGVKKLNYIVGTHPHADHIGGMADIIDKFPTEKIMMPDADNNTKTFENVLDAVDRKGMVITVPKAGSTYELGNASFTILAPNSKGYKDLNDDSIVIRLIFGSTAFLLVGDAEEVSENEMLHKGYDLSSGLLKVGHHGSNSSSTLPFIKAVSPRFAVISVGKGNTYGHPTSKTIERLTSMGAQIFRTDLLGTIVATSDGKSITLNKKASPIKTTAPPSISKTPKPTKTIIATAAPTVKKTANPSGGSTTVYITDTGEKYHKSGCRYLSKSKHAISLEKARAQGYTPCSVCKPPR